MLRFICARCGRPLLRAKPEPLPAARNDQHAATPKPQEPVGLGASKRSRSAAEPTLAPARTVFVGFAGSWPWAKKLTKMDRCGQSAADAPQVRQAPSQMQRPPSTSSATPLIIEASSLHRKQAALPRSSGVEKRPMNVFSIGVSPATGFSATTPSHRPHRPAVGDQHLRALGDELAGDALEWRETSALGRRLRCPPLRAGRSPSRRG